MSELAVVVLAHGDPGHLHRLVGALDPLPVFLHVDGKTPAATHRAMVAGLPSRVRLVPRRTVHLASWSLVEAELEALALALASSDARHLAVISGSDYPLMSVDGLVAELRRAPGTRWSNGAMPVEAWSTPRHPDGGMWRLRYRFVVLRGRLVHVRGVPLRWPVPRKVPEGVEPRAGSQWKVYSRAHAESLLEAVRRHPELVRFWRTTLVPDETFAASVLGSGLVPGTPPLAAEHAGSWLIRWPEQGAYHPRWLEEGDASSILEQCARAADLGRPLLFARKVSGERAGSGLLAVLDEALRR